MVVDLVSWCDSCWSFTARLLHRVFASDGLVSSTSGLVLERNLFTGSIPSQLSSLTQLSYVANEVSV